MILRSVQILVLYMLYIFLPAHHLSFVQRTYVGFNVVNMSTLYLETLDFISY